MQNTFVFIIVFGPCNYHVRWAGQDYLGINCIIVYDVEEKCFSLLEVVPFIMSLDFFFST